MVTIGDCGTVFNATIRISHTWSFHLNYTLVYPIRQGTGLTPRAYSFIPPAMRIRVASALLSSLTSLRLNAPGHRVTCSSMEARII